MVMIAAMHPRGGRGCEGSEVGEGSEGKVESKVGSEPRNFDCPHCFPSTEASYIGSHVSHKLRVRLRTLKH